MQHTIAACSLHHRVPPGRKCRLSASRFHIVLRELDALLSTQQRQQDEHPLVRSHAGVEAEVPGERTLQYSHLVARFKLVTLRKLDQTVALALTQVIDDLTATRAGRISS